MMAGERYFIASVSLIGARNRIDRILSDLNEHQLVPSIELMAASIAELTDAIAQTHRDRLSDPRYAAPVPGCERGCGYDGSHRTCGRDDCHPLCYGGCNSPGKLAWCGRAGCT